MSRLFIFLGIVMIIAGGLIPFVLGTGGLSEDLQNTLVGTYCLEGEVPRIKKEKVLDGAISISTRIPAGTYGCTSTDGTVRDISAVIEASILGQGIHQLGMSTGLIVCSIVVSSLGGVLLVLGVLVRLCFGRSDTVVYKSAKYSGSTQTERVSNPSGRNVKKPGLSTLFNITKLFGLNINEESIERLKEIQQLQEDGEITDEEAKAKLNEILFRKQ